MSGLLLVLIKSCMVLSCELLHDYLCIGVSLSLHGVGWSLHEGHLFCLA